MRDSDNTFNSSHSSDCDCRRCERRQAKRERTEERDEWRRNRRDDRRLKRGEISEEE